MDAAKLNGLLIDRKEMSGPGGEPLQVIIQQADADL